MKKTQLTHQRLLEVLDYCQATGDFTRKIDAYRCIQRAGDKTGYVHNRTGYVLISVDGEAYLAHRLAVLYVTGEWPPEQVDHIDMNRANNAYANLRLANNAGNNRNRTKQANNTTGYKGVFFDPRCRGAKKWYSKIKAGNKIHSLGCFDSPEAAHKAYAKAAIRLHKEFAKVA